MAKSKAGMILFIIGVVGIGSLIGMLFQPGAWFESLNKPWFNPPGWLFGPVWTALYIMIGIAGWRTWEKNRDPMLKGLWILQMILNFAWSPAFFGAKSPLLALMIILPLLAVIVAFIVRAGKTDPTSRMLFLPYAAWVAFASMLNFSIFRLN